MDNSIILRSPVQVAHAIDVLSQLKIDPAKPFVVTIAPYRKKRTNSQLALLWVRHGQVADAVAEYTGMSAEDVHEILKHKFLTPKVIEIGDTIIERYTTKGLSTQDMTRFMEQIEAWATSELGLILASPQDRRAA